MPTLLVAESGADFAQRAAEWIAAALVRALQRAPRASLALSGGKTPALAYERLAGLSRTGLDWSRVDLYLADERCVPEHDPESNARLIEERLLSRLCPNQPRFMRMWSEGLDGESLAARYALCLPEQLDVLVLGLGEDGHTASLFPGGSALQKGGERVLCVTGPKPPSQRLSLGPDLLQSAREVLLLAAGTSKAPAVARTLLGPKDVQALPGQLSLHGTWLLDPAAASLLPAALLAPKEKVEPMTTMQLGMVGLGKMGANMVRRLARAGHECIGFDLDAANVASLAREGIAAVQQLEELVQALRPPRAVWVMVPAGAPTERVVGQLSKLLARGDVILDGGNTNYKDDVRRARELAQQGIHYVDVGTSGGVWGLQRGYCLMVGGSKDVVQRLQPIFRSLAPGLGEVPRTPGREGALSTCEEGYLHCGPVGAGHFVKMIHNGIEYGLMQAYAEGLDILHHANLEELPPEHRYQFDLAAITELWRRGSVVGSWLLDLTATALQQEPSLQSMAGIVADSGEGRWTVQAAIEEAVPAPVLSAALYARFRSRRQPTFADKVLSAMRKGFGGHVERQPVA